MKKLILLLIALFNFVSPAQSQNANMVQPFAPEANKADKFIKDWSQGIEITNYLQSPSLLGQLIEDRNLSDFDEVPGWIKDNLITDDQKLQKLANRLKVVYENIPEARRLKIVYFNNSQPFFALGNRSLVFISSTSVESFSDNEFAAGGFHELAHLVFAEYYWNLRRAGNAPAVKQIELNCDRFSYLMLKKARLPVKSLEQLLRKVDQLESQGNRDEKEARFYPSLEDRLVNLKTLDKTKSGIFNIK